mmetsp:Transcript_14990/g.52611  ORF Transcript_14990/g.52611 Transcript_14990/m.52611 type:complete len:363 (-) Transcript_14990:59-1147(-)
MRRAPAGAACRHEPVAADVVVALVLLLACGAVVVPVRADGRAAVGGRAADRGGGGGDAGRQPSARQENCWDADSGYSFGLCCNSLWGEQGLENCWNEAFSFERCCHFHAGGGNEMSLPLMDIEELHIAPAPHRVGHEPVLRLRQDLSKGAWTEQVPGFLWKQACAMHRWLEDLPDGLFRGRRILELGTGIGLLSLHAALRGGLVTGTDGSSRSLALARGNAELNLDPALAWNHLTWRLVRWEDAQSDESVRLLGLSGPYAVVICSALLYAPLAAIRHLVRLLWLATDDDSQILWGSGAVNDAAERAQKWSLLLRFFEVDEAIDAVAAGYTVVENTTVLRLRRRHRRRRRHAAVGSDGTPACE